VQQKQILGLVSKGEVAMATFRKNVNGHGVIDVVLHPSSATITRTSLVLASATELSFDASGERPFIGAASVEVLNIAPQDNGTALCRVNILWDHDLNVRITYTVI
jgi:hypothetical protein